MNSDQARTLIKNTFTLSFDKTSYRTFVINVLNRIDESKAQAWDAKYIKDAFKHHVQRYERVGTYTSPNKETLDILIVHLTNESKLERTRTAIRNFVADHLKTRDEKDAALVAFVSPTEKQWRFSYVKMDYATVQKESGKIGVETRLTPARRFSYLVGEGESSHTAQSRFLDLLQDTKTDPQLSNIEEAFSVEAVTKEFFTKYAELFEQINKALLKLVEKDKAIRDEFKTKEIQTVDFAKKLMGQIVFLYFLQKKGWLGVEKGKEWGSGPHNFLRRLANKEYGTYENFFNDVLEPLFYDTLATDRGHEAWDKRFKCRIPFLNGGLFEPLGNYNWKKTDIVLPEKLFTNKELFEEGITGTGVLDVFDRYNFTVNESEPLEKEVAIDPEMLGKVFENLIEENRRKGLGAYYTPREIVHYMCQESLINYLDTSVNKEKELISHLDIETFIHIGEQISHYEAVETEYKFKMPPSIEKNARLIDDALSEITVCDPAVGSGAFPVGMMSEIVRARAVLTSYFNDVNERTAYYFKRHAIQNCLYGVDIDTGAVEIAKLRLWLSLVVDEENAMIIKPLPNLDYKIVSGNSLLGLPFKSQRLDKLEELKQIIFNETDHDKKASLKARVDELLAQVFVASKKSLGYKVNFDFQVFFPEVFKYKNGFDVVIANPPYVLLQDANRDDKLLDVFKNNFVVASFKVDLYHLFIEKGIRLLKRGGCVSYITPSNFATNNYAVSLRRFMLNETALRNLIFFSHDVFEASVNNSVFVATKTTMGDVLFQRGEIVSTRLVIETKAKMKQIDLIDDKCLLVSPENIHATQILKRIDANEKRIGDVATVNFGMQLRDRSEYTNDVIDNSSSKSRLTKYHRECYTGKDIKRYAVAYSDRFCFFNREAKRGGCWDEEIHNAKGKILVRQIGDYPEGGIDDKGYAVLNTAFMIVPKNKSIDSRFLLAILNSNVVKFYWINRFQDDRKTFPKIKGEYLKLIPIPDISLEKQSPIIALVDRINGVKKRNPNESTVTLELEIDKLVYKLYELTKTEIGIVEGRAAKKK